jgi:quercetin dioxygenase-like cupin family protein
LNRREIVCGDLGPALDDLLRQGFRLQLIYPADEPHTAYLADGDTEVRLTCRPDASPIPAALPPFAPEFLVTRAASSAATGRAGMLYRDLIPGRLGGRYIASHILVPGGGPVADWVHFHGVVLQMIIVARGWVRVVYEDQGNPILMREGDLVVQPPGIRHRVIESSPGLEVVEITAPALHATFSDDALELPNGSDPERLFEGQRFIHHVAADAQWSAFDTGEAKEARIGHATAGLAEARVVRPGAASCIDFAAHEGELVFGFLLEGTARLEFGGERDLGRGDAFVVPPGRAWRLARTSPDVRLLHVTTARLPLAVFCGSPL